MWWYRGKIAGLSAQKGILDIKGQTQCHNLICSSKNENIKFLKIILQSDDCGASEAVGVVCDTEGTEIETRYKNCFLASPLYYPLRLAERHYKR